MAFNNQFEIYIINTCYSFVFSNIKEISCSVEKLVETKKDNVYPLI